MNNTYININSKIATNAPLFLLIPQPNTFPDRNIYIKAASYVLQFCPYYGGQLSGQLHFQGST
jgi:hypothetical protein